MLLSGRQITRIDLLIREITAVVLTTFVIISAYFYRRSHYQRSSIDEVIISGATISAALSA